MSHHDPYVARELTKQHDNGRQRRSEGQYRLHWATLSRQALPVRRRGRLLSYSRRALAALRQWLNRFWAPGRLRLDAQENTDTKPIYLPISEQGEA